MSSSGAPSASASAWRRRRGPALPHQPHQPTQQLQQSQPIAPAPAPAVRANPWGSSASASTIAAGMTRRQTTTTPATAAEGVGAGRSSKGGKGGAAKKNSGNTKRNDTTSKQKHQPRQLLLLRNKQAKKKKEEVKKMDNDEQFPSLPLQLQLQSAGDFPSLTAGTSGSSAGSGAGGAAGSKSISVQPPPSTATGGNKKSTGMSRGWEAQVAAKTQAVPLSAAAAASASAGKTTTKKTTSGEGTNKAKKHQQQQKQQSSSETRPIGPDGADTNKTNQKKKNKKKNKGKSKKVPTDPRLAAAFQPLPAAMLSVGTTATAARWIPPLEQDRIFIWIKNATLTTVNACVENWIGFSGSGSYASPTLHRKTHFIGHISQDFSSTEISLNTA